MSIIYSAIVPHAPIILPSIGKEYIKKLHRTIQSIEKINRTLYLLKPDTILIISPHNPAAMPDAFGIHIAAKYEATFEEFGDLSTKVTFDSDVVLADKIKGISKGSQFNVLYSPNENIDYGAAVPLYYLTQNINCSVLSISPSELDLTTVLEFGYLLQNILQTDKKRIAIIASGDLSHRLTRNAPAGYSKIGAKFDKEIIGLIKENNVEELIKLDPHFVQEAAACGLHSFALLMGVLKNMNYQTKILSYEGPLGIGHLVADFTF
jgi:MEMO1 family protein